MAVQATAQWWIRTDGDDDNGGGFDSGISGAGTNYSDQATAQLDLTDLATASAGSTTLTSVTGGFTPAMIGNCVKIRSGTNVTNGYYFITAYTDTNTVTIDRACDNGGGGLSGGSGRLGGAFGNVETSVTLQAAGLGNNTPSPVIPGNTINIRGSGSDDPATPDYYFTSYRNLVQGTTTDKVKVVGYNGRPSMQASASQGSITLHNSYQTSFENLKMVANGATNSNYGLLHGGVSTTVINCIFDLAGHDALGTTANAINCYFKNSGSASNCRAVQLIGYNQLVTGNVFDINTTDSIIIGRSAMGTISSNIFKNSGGKGYGPTYQYINHSINFINNIFYGLDTGIEFVQRAAHSANNIFVNCATAIEGTINATGHDVYNHFQNVFYNCANKYSGISTNDGYGDIILTADPFVDAANGDFNLNATNGGGGTLRSTNYTLGG